MPKSRKSQPAMLKKPRTKTPPLAELEDAITSEIAEGETPTGTPTPDTYVVSEAEPVSVAISAGEDTFVTPLLVVPAPKGKTPKLPVAAPTPEPAPRLVDTANLLFAHSPGTISSDVARGRAAHLRRRLDEAHRETLLGLRPETRATSPPRPGAQSQALTAAQLVQIKGYLQDQQLVLEDRGNGLTVATARPIVPCLLYTSPSPRD